MEVGTSSLVLLLLFSKCRRFETKFEDFSLLLDGCDMILKVGRLAGFSIELQVVDEMIKVLGGINNLELFKILHESLNVWQFLVSCGTIQ